MSSVYENQGLRFQYPENWTIEESRDEDGALQLTVSSPNTAFWSLSVYPERRDVRLLLEEVLQAMQAEYPELEHEAADHWIEKTPLAGYDLNFYYLDLTNTAIVRVFQIKDSTCLLLAQAEDHELEVAEPVFQAMMSSLLSE